MKDFHTYWSVNAIRGVLTLIAATAIFALPRAAAYAYDIPIILLISVGCYAVFTMLEAGGIFLTAQTLPGKPSVRKALYPQAGLAIVFASLLFLAGYRLLPLTALFWIAATQAAVAALSEYAIARSTHHAYGCLSCYSTVIVCAVAAVTLPFAALLAPESMTLALAAWVGAFGLSEFALGSRMLFVEYRSEHPAIALSNAWQLEMEPGGAAQPVAAVVCAPSISCRECVADAICSDNSVAAQMATILNSRQPSIVRAARAAAILRSAEQPHRQPALAHR
jgi:hypothetical protein